MTEQETKQLLDMAEVMFFGHTFEEKLETEKEADENKD